MIINPLILYAQNGCPGCAQAIPFWQRTNLPLIIIEINIDPFAAEGIKALHSSKQIMVPALVSPLTKEYVFGFNQLAYERIADAYRAAIRAVAPDHPAVKSNGAGAVASETPQQESAIE